MSLGWEASDIKPERLTDPVIIQSSDGEQYGTMLDVTAPNVMAFCRKQRLGYRSFRGIKSGHWQWHSCFNRLYMFDELITEGFGSWAIHLDADAYVVDMEFSLQQYLDGLKQKAGILVHSGATPETWDVNNGVMFLNLGTRVARKVVKEWIHRHREISDEPEYLSRERPYYFGDQRILQNILRDEPEWFAEFHIESDNLINSMHATFIRHHLRAVTPNFHCRLEKIRQEVAAIG